MNILFHQNNNNWFFYSLSKSESFKKKNLGQSPCIQRELSYDHIAINHIILLLFLVVLSLVMLHDFLFQSFLLPL